MLEALGLLGDNTLKHKAPAAPRVSAPMIREEDLRRSSRASKKVVQFQSLTDSFFEQEEREAEGKGGVDVRRDAGSRKRGAPLSFQEEQERDFAEREAKSNLRREQAERAKRAMMAHAARQQQLAQVPGARFVVQAAPIALAADLPVVDETTYCRPVHQFAYPTLSKRARCPHCSGVFVITAKGALHKHDCRPSYATSINGV